MVCRECEKEVSPVRFEASRWMCVECASELEGAIRRLMDQTSIYFDYEREKPA